MAAENREIRIHGSLLAAAEKRLLIWIARRLPRWINSDHLTVLGAVAMLGAGLSYVVAPKWAGALLVAVLMLAINWFGDSLDGTVARVRHHERPRYGFYVDHVLDAIGILFLIAGLVAGGFMSLAPGAAFLLAYYLLTIEIALATHTLGTFKISVLEVRADRIADSARRRNPAAAPLAVEHDWRTPPAPVRHWRDGWRHRGAADVHHRGNSKHHDAVSARTDPRYGSGGFARSRRPLP